MATKGLTTEQGLASQISPPLTFKEFEDLVKNTERFYIVGFRLSDAVAKESCEYLIQEASMAFTKTLMSLLGFLRFIPSSKFHAKEGDSLIDLSSAAVMGRQVLEDVLCFLYLSEPNLPKEQKDFRELVWRYHGLGESIESAEFLESFEWSNPDLPATREFLEKASIRLTQHPLWPSITKNQRDRILGGYQNRVIHNDEILKRRGIKKSQYGLPHKVLSNFVHFSSFSHSLILDTNGDWQKSWPEFFLPVLYVAAFIADAVKAFIETFPKAESLLNAGESKLIENYRGELQDR